MLDILRDGLFPIPLKPRATCSNRGLLLDASHQRAPPGKLSKPRAGLKGDGFRPEEGRKVGVEGGCLPPGPQPIDSPTGAPSPLERKKNLRGPGPRRKTLKNPGAPPPGETIKISGPAITPGARLSHRRGLLPSFTMSYIRDYFIYI